MEFCVWNCVSLVKLYFCALQLVWFFCCCYSFCFKLSIYHWFAACFKYTLARIQSQCSPFSVLPVVYIRTLRIARIEFRICWFCSEPSNLRHRLQHCRVLRWLEWPSPRKVRCRIRIVGRAVFWKIQKMVKMLEMVKNGETREISWNHFKISFVELFSVVQGWSTLGRFDGRSKIRWLRCKPLKLEKKVMRLVMRLVYSQGCIILFRLTETLFMNTVTIRNS